MYGVGRVAEKTDRVHGIAEAAIAKATSATSQMESNVALLAVQAEATTVRAVSALSKRMQKTAADMEAKMPRVVGAVAQ